MTILNRKLFRELGQSKGQSLAIAAVVASGVAVFVMSLSTLSFLRNTRDAYYDRNRFADIFVSLTRAPESLTPQLASIAGVSALQTRIVTDVNMDVDGVDEPATARLISIPEFGPPRLNDIFLRLGRHPDPRRSDEVLASEAFFVANEMSLGDEVSAVLNGRFQSLRIVGVVLSPEYVFQIRPGELLPDDRRFGVFWMYRRHLESAFDMKGAFNDLSVGLLRGKQPESVIESLDRLLKPYGCAGSIDRSQQISAVFLDSELQQLRGMAIVAPVIFLGVAVFLLHVVTSRRIASQREIIATLKAFGFGNGTIGWHYLQAALLVTTIGSLAGAIAGVVLASGLASLYSDFYRFPDFIYQPDFRVIVLGVAISVIAAVLGTFISIQSVVRLMPAAAMQPAAPSKYRRSLLEWLGLGRMIPLSARMIIRQLGRRPLGAMFSVLGISASVAILVMGNFSPDAINYLLEFQFAKAQRQDVQVTFEQPVAASGLNDLKHLPGVHAVEPFRSVGIEIRHGHRHRRVGLVGLGERRDLYRLLDSEERPVRIPPSGVVLTDTLAKLIGVQAGDRVTVELLEGKRQTFELIVAGLVQEYSGLNAYAELSSLHRLLQEDRLLSGAYLSVDSINKLALYQELKQTPKVASVTVKEAAVQQFNDTISENILMIQSFNVFFAAVIAFGVVYNTARVSLDERCRELSTMRVIGFTKMEVSILLIGELAVLTIAAIPVGCLIGYAFCYAMTQGFESEQFRIPLVIRSQSYAFAAVVTLIAASVSALIVRRRLDQLDLVEVLKSRE